MRSHVRPVWHQAGDDIAKMVDLLAEAPNLAPEKFKPLPGNQPIALLRSAAYELLRRQLQSANEDKARLVIQEIQAVDDLVRAANLLAERLAEWYALHSPEAVRRLDGQKLAAAVSSDSHRASVMEAIGLDHEFSMGAELADADLAVVQGFAKALSGLYETWGTVETRIGQLMAELAPNVAALLGPMLGARLISQAGGLQKLAIMNVGTVQTLGAETALFRHLKEGKNPPKHGILFQMPGLHQAPPWHRGAIAKHLASLVAIAARADALTGNDVKASVVAAWEAGLHEIVSKPRPQKRFHKSPQAPGKKGKGKPSGKNSGPRRDEQKSPPRRSHSQDKPTPSKKSNASGQTGQTNSKRPGSPKAPGQGRPLQGKGGRMPKGASRPPPGGKK